MKLSVSRRGYHWASISCGGAIPGVARQRLQKSILGILSKNTVNFQLSSMGSWQINSPSPTENYLFLGFPCDFFLGTTQAGVSKLRLCPTFLQLIHGFAFTTTSRVMALTYQWSTLPVDSYRWLRLSRPLRIGNFSYRMEFIIYVIRQPGLLSRTPRLM